MKEWTEGFLSNRNRNARDGENGKQRHLKAGVENRCRVRGEHDDGGEPDGVELMSFPPQHAATEIESDHAESALDGLAETGKERVGEREGDGREGCRNAWQAEAAGDPEDQTGKNGEVHAGNDEQVEGAGALEADAQAVTKKGAVAGKHGGEHRCVVVRKPEEPGNSRRDGLIGETDEAFAGGLLDGMEATGKG